MGDQPPWHRLLVAAKNLGVAPWVLERQPIRYVLQAEAAAIAEQAARANKAKMVKR